MPQISIERGRLLKPGAESSVDIHPTSDGRIAISIESEDLRIHVVTTPEETTMLGVALVKMSAVVEAASQQRVAAPPTNGAPIVRPSR